MTVLVAGLLLFLGTHSVRIFADEWRSAQIERIGEKPWKALYSLASVLGLGLIVWGYGMTRAEPALWQPPGWLRDAASALVLVSFVLIAAAYVPRNRIKAALGHPMLAGVKTWAFAHLIANGRPGDLVLFGAFLLWAILAFRSSRRRDRAAGKTYPAGALAGDVSTAVAGVVAWVVFAFWLHAWLIGVSPLA